MISRRIGSCIVALALGVVTAAMPVRAAAGFKPCSLVSVGETELLTGDSVVKSMESASACQRWLAGGRTFLLALGPRVITPHETEAAIREIGGTWVQKQFGEITCTSAVVPSNLRANTTTCSAGREPLFYADGFDNATVAPKTSVFFTLQVTGGQTGAVPIEHMHALAAKVFARLP